MDLLFSEAGSSHQCFQVETAKHENIINRFLGREQQTCAPASDGAKYSFFFPMYYNRLAKISS